MARRSPIHGRHQHIRMATYPDAIKAVTPLLAEACNQLKMTGVSSEASVPKLGQETNHVDS